VTDSPASSNFSSAASTAKENLNGWFARRQLHETWVRISDAPNPVAAREDVLRLLARLNREIYDRRIEIFDEALVARRGPDSLEDLFEEDAALRARIAGALTARGWDTGDDT
jgi:hypothetical protein